MSFRIDDILKKSSNITNNINTNVTSTYVMNQKNDVYKTPENNDNIICSVVNNNYNTLSKRRSILEETLLGLEGQDQHHPTTTGHNCHRFCEPYYKQMMPRSDNNKLRYCDEEPYFIAPSFFDAVDNGKFYYSNIFLLEKVLTL